MSHFGSAILSQSSLPHRVVIVVGKKEEILQLTHFYKQIWKTHRGHNSNNVKCQDPLWVKVWLKMMEVMKRTPSAPSREEWRRDLGNSESLSRRCDPITPACLLLLSQATGERRKEQQRRLGGESHERKREESAVPSLKKRRHKNSLEGRALTRHSQWIHSPSIYRGRPTLKTRRNNFLL